MEVPLKFTMKVVIPLNLPQSLDLDEAYNDITEDQEEDVKQRLKSKWSVLKL